MRKVLDPKSNEIEAFVKEHFGNEEVAETILLVKKEQLDGLSETVEASGLSALIMMTEMSASHAKQVMAAGGEPDDYQQVVAILRVSDTSLFLKVLQHAGASSLASARAKAIAEFLSDDNNSGGTLQ
jgi:hypothetical protein